MCTCVHVEERGAYHVFLSMTVFFFSWDNVSHWTRSSLISLDWLSTTSQGSPCLPTQLSTLSTEVIDLCHSHIWFFWRVAAKDRTRVLMFASQAFYWLRFATSLKDPNFLTITVPIIKQWKAWPFLGVTLTLWWSYGTRPTKTLMTHSSATQTTRCQRSSLFPRASC